MFEVCDLVMSVDEGRVRGRTKVVFTYRPDVACVQSLQNGCYTGDRTLICECLGRKRKTKTSSLLRRMFYSRIIF